MKINYLKQDRTLILNLSNKLISKEVSQDWNTHISYASDGSVVQVVILDAQIHFTNQTYQ